MKVMMIHAKIKPDKVAKTEAGVKKLFAALEQAQLEGIHYASTKLADGTTFVILLGLDSELNPLDQLPEADEFQENLKDCLAEPPVVEPLEVLGSYKLFT